MPSASKNTNRQQFFRLGRVMWCLMFMGYLSLSLILSLSLSLSVSLPCAHTRTHVKADDRFMSQSEKIMKHHHPSLSCCVLQNRDRDGILPQHSIVPSSYSRTMERSGTCLSNRDEQHLQMWQLPVWLQHSETFED